MGTEKQNFTSVLNLIAGPELNVNETWEILKETMKETAVEQIGFQTNEKKEDRMTSEILELME